MAAKGKTRAEVAATWRERLDRWQQRRCSVREFCRREGISEPSFFQWRKRLAAARGTAFIPLEVVPAAEDEPRPEGAASGDQRAAWLEISLGGLVCRVAASVDEPTLRRLVRVLSEEAGRC